MATLIRKDAWKLSAISTWEPTLLWYAKAVEEMSTRPAKDPTSWRFQAGMHGYSKQSDPLVKLGSLPTASVQKKFWKKCQHGTWFFLPWHRAYLGFFEQIVRQAVVKLGGPADWTLPYWNYSDTSNPKARTIPPAFREKKLPDGSPNPLFTLRGVEILRDPRIIAGNAAAIPQQDVDLSGCLSETFYSPTTDTTVGDLGFGGPATGANHDAHVFGQNSVESLPHNAIHMAVGGDQTLGWMTDPDTAALDPIFWLHHCNIDRLWAVWNLISGSNTNPTGSVNVGGHNISWQTSIGFSFHDADAKVVTMKPDHLVDTTKTQFNYDYEDTSNPLGAPLTAAVSSWKGNMTSRRHPEMVGASKKKVTLTGSPQTTSFAIQPAAGPAKVPPTAAETADAKTYLTIENVVSKKSNATYEVYVNLPENPNESAYRDHYAGSMHLFGVKQASTRSQEHSGSGLRFSLDISDLVNRLKEKNAWDAKNIRVSFVPRGEGLQAHRSIQEHEPIKVGQVGIYRA